MEVVVTTGAIRRANLQSNVTTNKPTPSFLQAGCPSCRPTNSVKALKGNVRALKANVYINRLTGYPLGMHRADYRPFADNRYQPIITSVSADYEFLKLYPSCY